MPSESESLSSRLQSVQARIAAAIEQAKRSPAEVTLIAVTKTHSAATINATYNAGLRHFGENRAEEAVQKMPALDAHSDIIWHMIGHIQSRKAKLVANNFSRVHSIDRLKIANRLSQAAGESGRTLDALLEINLTGEASKHGFDLSGWPGDRQQESDFLSAVEQLLDLPHLNIDGLMTMPRYSPDPQDAWSVYAQLAALRERLADSFPQTNWRHLSMGMTNDFEVAIAQGATFVRVGTALFGPRAT